MNSLVTIDLISILFMVIALIGLLNSRKVIKSSRALIICFIANIVSTFLDATASFLKTDFVHLSSVFHILAYSIGTLSIIFFTYYCYVYISEKTNINKWYFFVPMICLAVIVGFNMITGFITSFIEIGESASKIIRGLNLGTVLFQLLFVFYLPSVALTKYKSIGLKSVFVLGFFGIIPCITTILSLVLKIDNYTYAAGSLSLMIVYVLLQNTLYYERDIEQHEKLELSRNEVVEYSKIVSNAGLGIWYIFLKDGVEPRMKPNEKMLEVLGLKTGNYSEEYVYSFWHDRILESELPSVNASVGEMLEGKFSENTYKWNHPSKGIVYVRCGGTAYFREDGTAVLSGYHADVTEIALKEKAYQEELKKALEDARKANAAKSAFFSQMSHDIRTPLNGIIGLIEINQKHSDDRKLVDENRQKAKIAANHLLALISDVLEISKISDSSVTLARECFNIVELARDVFSIVETKALEEGITLKKIKPNTPKYTYVYGSPLHVRQILINIFSNAIKYNKENGAIGCIGEMVDYDEKMAYFKFTISDTGIGMSPEFMKRMFEPFAQEHSDARSTYNGTGLGMSIVKSLVDKMGGIIEVRSKLGEGTTFEVTIPFEIASEQDLPAKPNLFTRDIKGTRVLLVEDNELNMEIAQTILKDLGLEVTTAANGRIACEKYIVKPPRSFDVILMDLMMPEMDGYEATRIIRSYGREDSATIPIVAMTANAFAEDVKKCLEYGMNGHISKPIQIAEMIATISQVIEANQ